ncbi:MAG: hypothetical protein IPO41_09215 [Acidobacteria bacterium]|nr:hypothetical protein [Acidobacteriota bacterium]
MAELNAKLIRDYFGGRWSCTTYKNGELVRENAVDIKGSPERPGGIGEIAFGILALGFASVDEHDQLAIAGWHSDINRWCDRCYNEAGGYSEHSWTSQGEINGVTVLYGTVHVCEKEGDDPADYIAMCELLDQDNFRYTIQSYQKGIVEIVANRVTTGEALVDIRENDRSANAGGSIQR